jgi:membrane-bound metal-dependent hydrolase YbcI (DUF457 family)
MPITPFHFGPGAAAHAIAPRYVSFLAFCSTNILIDFESLYNLINGRHPVHAFFHTYFGASLVIASTVGIFIFLRWLAKKVWLPDLLRWKELTMTQVVGGALLGGYSHVLLDSAMHQDIRPLAPLSDGNVLLSLVSLGALHWACIALGLAGAAGVGIRKVIAGEKRAA